MTFDAVFTVKKGYSKEDFLSAVIIYLGTRSETPIDVVDADFGEIKEGIREAIICTAEVQGICVADIGYDRQEPYTDYENYREKVGGQYVTRQRKVIKYRTVTDWQPFEKSYFGETTCVGYNEASLDTGNLAKAIATIDLDSIVRQGEAEVDSMGLSWVIRDCETQVGAEKVRFPGDRYKDVHYDAESEVKTLVCYKLPYYEVSYVYDGRKYTAWAFACGNICIEADLPKNNADVTEVVEQKTQKYRNKRKISWTLFAITFVIAAVLCFVFKFGWLLPLPIIFLIMAKRNSDKYSKEYQKCSDQMTSGIAQAKMDAINAALEKHNLSPVSDRYDCQDLVSPISGAKKLKSVKGRVVCCWLLCIVLAIASVFNIASGAYKSFVSNQMSIAVVDKQEEYDPDADYYINGCYYVHFDYEVQAKMLGVDSVELKVHVIDKNGNELGFIRSSLSDLDVSAGEKKVVSTTLKEHQPENNEFFTQLYNADLDDLKFEYEIGSVRYSSGMFYYNKNYNKFE